MELALYAPGCGYYERSVTQVGRAGDFYTSVSVGPFFGELLAFQFADWLGSQLARDRARIVEAGAHDGRLASDILTGFQTHAPGLLSKIEYWIIEPSPARQAAQKARLASFINVRWFHAMPEAVEGIIFANELLDAMPVHLFAWSRQAHQWYERGVGLNSNGVFEWSCLARSAVLPPQLPAALLDVLPDGYTLEVSPAAAGWWDTAAKALRNGWLLTLDYGGALEELLNPGRTTGTVRGYSRHSAVSNILERPGEFDITADVNFTEIQIAGEKEGLRTDRFVTQPQFLTAVARELWARSGTCPPHQVRQFQTLTHPEHLGRRFRVLVQERLQ